MAYGDSENLDAFREEVRSWLEDNCPQSMRTPMPENEVVWGGRNASYPNPDSKLWLDRMGEKGWTAPEWPAEYGGGGLSKAEAKVLQEEMRAIKARPPLFSFGLWMFGPVLLEYGNEEQEETLYSRHRERRNSLGVRAILSRVRGLTLLVFKPSVRTRAIIT